MTEPAAGRSAPGRFVLVGIALLLIGYTVSAVFGLPQLGTKLTNESGPHAAAAPLDEPPSDAQDHAVSSPPRPPPLYMVIPFALLLGCIAVAPLLRATEH